MRCLLFIAFNFYDYKLSHGDENKNKTSLFMREKKIIVHECLIACIMIDFIPGLYLLALRCIEREDKQCHEFHETEREKGDLS